MDIPLRMDYRRIRQYDSFRQRQTVDEWQMEIDRTVSLVVYYQ
ncbi:MAG: hypothetical protein R3C26_02290 [Calditrichia bacterium]